MKTLKTERREIFEVYNQMITWMANVQGNVKEIEYFH